MQEALPVADNLLYYGDNLPILHDYIATASVDLVYLDPPFNSSRHDNVLFRNERGQESEAQITAFEDTWHWNAAAQATYEGLLTGAPPRVGVILTCVWPVEQGETMLSPGLHIDYLLTGTVAP